LDERPSQDFILRIMLIYYLRAPVAGEEYLPTLVLEILSRP
jgi:hypothetical protein